ncbi:hypothetical protein [Roseomonas elaeocarpi]|uniref:Uncharacterized protein n=1 Tax=Roseomonas elaeocarpi TaxID=907779 RepID=A0ABV6JMJ6_9PROT
MSERRDQKDAQPGAEQGEADRDHTQGGAPKDSAHEDAGDGALTGSVPAGLSREELRRVAESDKTDDGGTG